MEIGIVIADLHARISNVMIVDPQVNTSDLLDKDPISSPFVTPTEGSVQPCSGTLLTNLMD